MVRIILANQAVPDLQYLSLLSNGMTGVVLSVCATKAVSCRCPCKAKPVACEHDGSKAVYRCIFWYTRAAVRVF